MNFMPSGHGTGYPGDGFNDGPSSRGRGGREEFTQPTSLPITPYTGDSYPFFLPGEGISRQVIQTDLPRYLGNNSHCKPGRDEFGRSGFWYKGYRPLTDAQIHTLREDSARWNDERQRFSDQSGGHRGPDYVDSHTFRFSHKNYVTEHNPNGGTYQRGPVEPSARPPIPIPEPARPEPRYRYMPSPDNRPWYDNWTKQYVHPFREPGAKSPEPPENTPRYMDPLEPVVVPLPEGSSVPSNPLDSTTGLPMPGYWTQGRDGEWTFRTTGDPIRATHIRPGRDGGEE